MQLRKLASAFVVFAALFASSFAAFAADPENTMIITLKDGDVTIALRPDLAPKHVEQIKELVREGAYDNVAFHRVIDGFMAQTGDVQYRRHEGRLRRRRGRHRRLGTARPAGRILQEALRARHGRHGPRAGPELGQFAVLHHVRAGSVLDGQYTVVGKVESGMELVDKIKKGDEAQQRRRSPTPTA